MLSTHSPRDKFDEVVVERDAGSGVEDAAEVAGHEVTRDDLVLGVAKDAFHRSVGGRLHRRLDLVVARLYSPTPNHIARK